jgi:DNA repair exonuclease SbcCD ATPase subunit
VPPEELLTAQEQKMSGLRTDLETSNQEQMAALEGTHNTSLAELQDQLSQAQLAAADTSAVDSLKTQVIELEEKLAIAEEATRAAEQESNVLTEELIGKHDAKLAEIQGEKAELEQKYNATTARVEELGNIHSEHTAALAQLETVTTQLSATEEKFSGLQSTHDQTFNELDTVKARNQELEEKIDSGERELNEQIGKNMSLLTQLTEVDSTISANRKRIRELEAELAALKDKPEINSESASSKCENAKETTGPDPAEDGEHPGAA